MYAVQQKKVIILAILEILNKHTDSEHRLSAKNIMDMLAAEYGLDVDRKAVKRNLMDLIDFGYDIEYSEKKRTGKQGVEANIYTDWYIIHKFDNSELRLLIDSLLFSKHIPYSQCKDLIDKLKSLTSSHFEASVKHVHNLPENGPANKALFSVIDLLDDAIQRKKQVVFNYTEYTADKARRIKTDKAGGVVEYIINPYQMVTANGRYYLICNHDRHVDLAHYRVDRIENLRVLEKGKAKPLREVKGAENGLNLPQHMAEHIYMYSGEGVRVTFRANRSVITDIVDWFGLDFSVKEIDGETIEIIVKVNEQAMYNWAMQYGSRVEVLKPKSLRDSLAKTAAEMAGKYN